MSQKGKVIFLHSSSELYGASKILLYVMNIFRDLGYPTLIILPGDGPLRPEIERQGFEYKIMNLGILRRKHFHPRGILDRGKKLYTAYRFLDEIYQKEPISLIYSNTLAVIVGATFARRRGLPHIWHIHEIIQSPKFLVKFLASQVDRSTSKPIVVSESVSKHWQKYLDTAKPVVIHNGIEVQSFSECTHDIRKQLGIAPHKKVMTMIGRINPGKGQLFYLDIAKKVISINPDTVFLMVGDPYPGYEDIENEINNKISSENLDNHVINLGFREDIPQILKTTDIFVLPSILPDSFPTVVLEAMASAKPVIATKSGGASEMVVDGKTGYLVNIGDTSEASSRITQLCNDPRLASDMGKAGKVRLLEEYSFEHFAEKMKNYICQILP
ncbi:glycosyltransferase family 4 protein [Mongoliibacter ruber]|uniref:Glycosyltransferase involved in cell wall biosynthesis n=1 Tax=Mongoliibacter ruber TaxID=1750599 RepID=A0A2T0WT83_9BACT|nr:glycosyltransferase family 4 protein [Mongoliibacter ruber]PRY89877.1 glycosyltransferase involved in cell wall biosynthesis [Mongoliibacter ruber]